MLKQSEDTIEWKTELTCDKLIFLFKPLKRRSTFPFNPYHTGNAETKLLLNGKIKEGKILNKTVDIEKQISLVMDIGNISLIPLASGIGSLFLAIVSLFTVGHHNKSDR